jgi:hypothetical protein
MLRGNKLRHSYLDVTKLENYGPKGKYLNNNYYFSEVGLLNILAGLNNKV